MLQLIVDYTVSNVLKKANALGISGHLIVQMIAHPDGRFLLIYEDTNNGQHDA